MARSEVFVNLRSMAHHSGPKRASLRLLPPNVQQHKIFRRGHHARDLPRDVLPEYYQGKGQITRLECARNAAHISRVVFCLHLSNEIWFGIRKRLMPSRSGMSHRHTECVDLWILEHGNHLRWRRAQSQGLRLRQEPLNLLVVEVV